MHVPLKYLVDKHCEYNFYLMLRSQLYIYPEILNVPIRNNLNFVMD